MQGLELERLNYADGAEYAITVPDGSLVGARRAVHTFAVADYDDEDACRAAAEQAYVEMGGTLPEADPPPDATDAAAELAAEHGIDLASVTGTLKDGRIGVKDVRKAVR